MERDELLDELRPKITEYMENETHEEFSPGETKIRLSYPTFGGEEVMEALESLLSTYVTMGDKVHSFEDQWAEYLGSRHATMVNSGSSANLVAMESIADRVQGGEVIVPAVSWSTSIFPIHQVGARPVLTDVERETYTLGVEALKEAISPDTEAIMPVHLLGNPADMDAVMELADDHDLAVVEDCCEAHGARYDGTPVGTMGDLGTYSFFFSHHISTIEGGMVVTDEDDLAERNRMLRAHGWVRELDDREKYTEAHPDIDERFLFASEGYNLRPTEISGAFGIHQVDKLERFVERRRENAAYLNDGLGSYGEYFDILEERDGTRCSWFAYPLLLTEAAPFSKDELQQHLEEHQIETRPILAGNLARQPALDSIEHRVAGDLSVADDIHMNGLFIGNNHVLDEERMDYILDTIDTFIQQY